MRRAARGEAEGWKSRTLQAEAHIADLKLQVNDYRMQLGLPVPEADDANAPPGALPWHKSDEHTDIGAPMSLCPLTRPRFRLHLGCACSACALAQNHTTHLASLGKHIIASHQIEPNLADGTLMLLCVLTICRLSAATPILITMAGQAYNSAS